MGKLRAAKGDCLLDRADLFGHAAGLLLLAVPPQRPDAAFAAQVAALRAVLGGQLYLLACRRLDTWDAPRLAALAALGVPLIAANAPLYHVPERRPLHDVMTAIRLGTTVAAAGHALAANAEQHLKSPAEMARLFRDHPAAPPAPAKSSPAAAFPSTISPTTIPMSRCRPAPRRTRISPP